MTQYRTLADLPAAKRALEQHGYSVKRLKIRLNGRPTYEVTEPDGSRAPVTDYQLLDWANA